MGFAGQRCGSDARRPADCVAPGRKLHNRTSLLPIVVNAITNNNTKPQEKHQRTVHSFVRRTGRLTPGQRRAIDALWPEYGIDYSPQKLNLQRVFSRDAPTVLEIGFGNGEGMVSQAATNRGSDYLGVEVHRPGVGHCMMHAKAAGLSNLRIVCHDAIEVLQKQIPDHSLARINLYFPDPWPKKRHHKRRIVQVDFLHLAADKLKAGATLNIATDWANYAEHIDAVLDASSRFRRGECREHLGEQAPDRPTTRFEQRGLKQGHRIFDWVLIRI